MIEPIWQKIKRTFLSVMRKLTGHTYGCCETLKPCSKCEKVKPVKIIKQDAIFGRYPCCDLINNAIRFILDGKTDLAVDELLQVIWKADGYLREDLTERVMNIHEQVWEEMTK